MPLGMEDLPWDQTLKTRQLQACHQVQLLHDCSTCSTCCVLLPNQHLATCAAWCVPAAAVQAPGLASNMAGMSIA